METMKTALVLCTGSMNDYDLSKAPCKFVWHMIGSTVTWFESDRKEDMLTFFTFKEDSKLTLKNDLCII